MTTPHSASGSRVLHEERGFRYVVATEQLGEPIVRILSDSFAREPMSAALGISAGDLAPPWWHASSRREF